MAVTTIIVSGKLDYAEGSYLIGPDGETKKYLSAYIHAYIGERIVISVEEPEEESIALEEQLTRPLKRMLVPG